MTVGRRVTVGLLAAGLLTAGVGMPASATDQTTNRGPGPEVPEAPPVDPEVDPADPSVRPIVPPPVDPPIIRPPIDEPVPVDPPIVRPPIKLPGAWLWLEVEDRRFRPVLQAPDAADDAPAVADQEALTIAADSATLRCYPPGGTHPSAAAACRRLAAAGGDFDRLRPNPAIMCPMHFDPVTARAHGRWRGQWVSWEKTFSNSCMLYASTGPIFSF